MSDNIWGTRVLQNSIAAEAYNIVKDFKSSFSLESYIRYRLQYCNIPEEEFALYAALVADSYSSVPKSMLFGSSRTLSKTLSLISPMFSLKPFVSDRLNCLIARECVSSLRWSYGKYKVLLEIRGVLDGGYKDKSIRLYPRSVVNGLNSYLHSLNESLAFLGNVDCILYERQGYVCVEPYPNFCVEEVGSRLNFKPFVRAKGSFLKSYSISNEYNWDLVGIQALKCVEGLVGLTQFPIKQIRFTVGNDSVCAIYHPSKTEEGSFDIDMSSSVASAITYL